MSAGHPSTPRRSPATSLRRAATAASAGRRSTPGIGATKKKGLVGLRNRSHRPHVSPNATQPEMVEKIIYLRPTSRPLRRLLAAPWRNRREVCMSSQRPSDAATTTSRIPPVALIAWSGPWGLRRVVDRVEARSSRQTHWFRGCSGPTTRTIALTCVPERRWSRGEGEETPGAETTSPTTSLELVGRTEPPPTILAGGS